jgi:Metal-sensitive transcriptional repressor
MRADKKRVLNRLASIEGHLRRIRKMVEDDQETVLTSKLAQQDPGKSPSFRKREVLAKATTPTPTARPLRTPTATRARRTTPWIDWSDARRPGSATPWAP